MSSGIAVVKIGGSVLAGPRSLRRAAAWIGDRLADRPGERIIAVVSAERGVTDALLDTARAIVESPDPAALDLLWSTGELRSAALLALTLQGGGVHARAVNVHQTGLLEPSKAGTGALARVRPLRLLSLLAEFDVVVVPGFLARGAGDVTVSLGRGGSDLTAVLIAAALGADRCELVKDVPGYFTADPKHDLGARPLATVTFARALELERDGCPLVQRHALEAARRHGLPIVVRAIGHDHTTIVHDSDAAQAAGGANIHGVLDTNHSRSAALGAGHRLADRPDLPDIHV